jgi:malonate transporter
VNSFVISSLLPVVILIAAGYLAGRRRWIGGNAVKDLSNLIFLLLAPALLFRAMSTVHVQELRLPRTSSPPGCCSQARSRCADSIARPR